MELAQIISLGEGYHQEFKESIDKSLVRKICAFANAAGGVVFIGVSDKGIIKGVSIDNVTRSRLQDTINQIEPKVTVNIEYKDNLIIVTVPESGNKPHSCGDGFFMRVGPNSQKLTRNEIIELLQKQSIIQFDRQTNHRAKFDKHFSISRYQQFIRLAGISPTLPVEDILISLNCLTEQIELSNAGTLFFTDNIEFLILQAKVCAVLFKGTENITILDRKDFCGDIISNIDDSMIFLRKHLNLAYKIEHLKREEILEIPEIALREAVVNALCHRDYFEAGANVVISIFSDRVEISNPGGLPPGLQKEAFGRKSVTRNPIIADLLHRVGYIEKIGTGIKRIRDAVALHGGCSVEFEYDEYWFTTIFYRQSTAQSDNVTDNVTDKKSDHSEQRLTLILQLIINKPHISTTELATELKVSKRTILRDINILKQQNKLERSGNEKTGYWKINE